MHPKKQIEDLDLKPYHPFGLGIPLLKLLFGLTVISLFFTATYEFFF